MRTQRIRLATVSPKLRVVAVITDLDLGGGFAVSRLVDVAPGTLRWLGTALRKTGVCVVRGRVVMVISLVGVLLLTGTFSAQGLDNRIPSTHPGRPVSNDPGKRLDPAMTRVATEHALAQAQGLFAGTGTRNNRAIDTRWGSPDATMVLRDLAVGQSTLSKEDQKTARSLLARPSDGDSDPVSHGYSVPSEFTCSTHLCVHWVESTSDAPALADNDLNSVPDWVDTNITVFEQVWDHIVTDSGYTEPLNDASSLPDPGPDGRLDVYLADIAPIYGYCTSDDPNVGSRYDVSAYCVVDNDFAQSEFAAPPGDNLRVTAAHEFFHAVQFSYDWREDLWLMEGTATWMEDEVFDSINDNHQYFPASALRRPGIPVDYGAGGYQYGAWVFWRFLAEYFGTAQGADPDVIREVWERADASPGASDRHSLQAVAGVASARGVPFSRVFADFSSVGFDSHRWYEEGASYPQTTMARTHTLTRKAISTGWKGATMDHLASRNIAFRPGSTLTGRWRLRVSLDLPNTARGSVANFAVQSHSGSLRRLDVRLNRYGDATVPLSFSRSSVRRVVLTLTNASTRMTCWQQTVFSCAGWSRDDRLSSYYTAKAVR